MYAHRKDKRDQRINISATDLFRARCEYLSEKYGSQMTTWVYEYMAQKMDEDFAADSGYQELETRAFR